MPENANCWNCAYRQAGGMTFLGLCKIFIKVGKDPKEIPPTRVDVGCSHFIKKEHEKI